MKKIISVLLAAALLLTVCGCGKSDKWQAQYDLGVKYMDDGNYDEAVVAFKAAIKIDPKRAEAYSGAAKAYTAQGDYKSAKEILDEGYNATNDNGLAEEQDGTTLAEYLNNTIIEDYGVCPTGEKQTGEGLVSAYCADFDGDGNQEMVTARLIFNEDGTSTLLTELYKIDGDSVKLVDKMNMAGSFFPDVSVYSVKYDGLPCIAVLTSYGSETLTNRGSSAKLITAKGGKISDVCTAEWYRSPGGIEVSAEQNGANTIENAYNEDDGSDSKRAEYIKDNAQKLNDFLKPYGMSCTGGGDENSIFEFNFDCPGGTKLCSVAISDYDDNGSPLMTITDDSPWKYRAVSTLPDSGSFGFVVRFYTGSAVKKDGYTEMTADYLADNSYSAAELKSLKSGSKIRFQGKEYTVTKISADYSNITAGDEFIPLSRADDEGNRITVSGDGTRFVYSSFRTVLKISGDAEIKDLTGEGSPDIDSLNAGYNNGYYTATIGYIQIKNGMVTSIELVPDSYVAINRLG